MISKNSNGMFIVYGYGRIDSLLEDLTLKELKQLEWEIACVTMDEDCMVEDLQRKDDRSE